MDSKFESFGYVVINEYDEIISNHLDYDQAEMHKIYCEDEGLKVKIMEVFVKVVE